MTRKSFLTFLLFGFVFVAGGHLSSPALAQSSAQENLGVPSVDGSVITLMPFKAECGRKEVSGPYITDKWLSKSDCTQAVIEKDKVFGKIERGVSGGVVEFHFQLPDGVESRDVVSVVTNVDMFCSGGVGISTMNEIGGWATLGADLPSDQYKPDGTYGYLSCGSGQQKKVLSVEIPLNEDSNQFSFRLTGDELSAEALVDLVSVTITTNEFPKTGVSSQEQSGRGVCTVNGKPVDCGEFGDTVGNIFLGLGAIIVFLVLVGIFWLFMLVHAIRKPIENKILWIVLLLIIGPIAAIVYYFVVRRHFTDVPQTPSPFTPSHPPE